MSEKKVNHSLSTIILLIIIFISISFGVYFLFFANKATNNTTSVNVSTSNNTTTKNEITTQTNTFTATNDVSKNENNTVAKTTAAKNITKILNIDEAYNKIIEDYSKASDTFKTTKVDIDNDGTNELLILSGDVEALKTLSFYTFKNGEAIGLGTIGFGHSMIYDMNNADYLLQVYGQMENEQVTKIYIENDKIKTDIISGRQINPGESYTKGDIALMELLQ